MTLTPGTRLGSYEIVSLLGAGGMGEVYRARDPRLKREIALKVLPEGAAADPDRRERFTREALVVAALNHPHIVTIHSVEDAPPAVFLTMELVEGRSLAEALPPTGLPVDRVLTIGIAVADAISAAHQKGVTATSNPATSCSARASTRAALRCSISAWPRLQRLSSTHRRRRWNPVKRPRWVACPVPVRTS